MLCIPFREPLVNDVAAECVQIVQIIDDATGICYEFVKDVERNNILVHYTKDDNYVIKQYTDKNITFEKSIEVLGLSIENLTLDAEFAYYGLESLLKWKVCDLPLLQGTIKSA